MNENPFEAHAGEYDAWYDTFPNTFRAEVLAIRALLPAAGRWIEVGVGTGRFAAELGISLGVEPAEAMAALARTRDVEVICGVAEALPLDSESVDAVFLITTLCFVQDLQLSLAEAWRVLRPGGHCIIGLLPLDSPLGQIAHSRASEDSFLKHAHLRTTDQVLRSLRAAGFTVQQTNQTLIGPPEDFERTAQSPTNGTDRGSFVGICALNPPETSSLSE